MAKVRKKTATTSVNPPDQPVVLQTSGNATAAAVIDVDRIAYRAYELYVKRGASPGRALDDWLEAEQELLGQTRGSLERGAGGKRGG